MKPMLVIATVAILALGALLFATTRGANEPAPVMPPTTAPSPEHATVPGPGAPPGAPARGQAEIAGSTSSTNGVADLDDQAQRERARQRRQEVASQLAAARQETREQLRARAEASVDNGIRRLEEEVGRARDAGDEPRARMLEQRLQEMRADRGQLIRRFVEAAESAVPDHHEHDGPDGHEGHEH